MPPRPAGCFSNKKRVIGFIFSAVVAFGDHHFGKRRLFELFCEFEVKPKDCDPLVIYRFMGLVCYVKSDHLLLGYGFFNEWDSSLILTFFKSLVRSLRYLTCTRSDILYVIGLVSQYMKNSKTTHFKAVKRIIRYIKGTTNFGLLFSFSNDYKLVGYSDNDWGGAIDDRKSTT